MNLPSAIAMTPPQNVIHNGKPGGSVRPNNNPDIAADQSETVDSFLEYLHKRCSVSTLEPVAVISTSNALNPKEYTENAATGNNAKTTFCMIASVLEPFTI
jgi:hypothetical protein